MIPAQSRRAGPYTGDGTTTVFSFGFAVLSPTDVAVYARTSAGVNYMPAFTPAINSDQSVTPGGSVTLSVAPSSGDQIVVIGGRQSAQTVDILSQGGFDPNTIELGLDSLAIAVQQAEEALARCYKAGVVDTTVSTDLSAQISTMNAILTQFETEYLGAKASAPTLDNDGLALAGGALYFNTSTLAMYVWTGSVWQLTQNQINPTVQSFTATTNQTVFTLSFTPLSAQVLLVFTNGTRNIPTTDYTVSGTTLTFSVGRSNGAVISVLNLGSAAAVQGTALLSDGTVGAPSLSFTAQTNIGLYRSAANQLDMVTGGATRLRAQASGVAVTGAMAATGAVSGTTGTFSGAVSGTTGTFSGVVSVDPTAGIVFTGEATTKIARPSAGMVDHTVQGTRRLRLTNGATHYLGGTSFTNTTDSLIARNTAKAWCSYTEVTTTTIIASYNVSSITDNGGTGDTTISFTTSLANANYCLAGSVTPYPASNEGWGIGSASTERLVGSVRLHHKPPGNSDQDAHRVDVVIFGA